MKIPIQIKKNNKNILSNKGYAMLFSIVIISIISLLAIGLSNTSYKQLILSSVARDSQTSFFESDTATECALYADTVDHINSSTGTWLCGVDQDGVDNVFKTGDLLSGNPGYRADYQYNNQTYPCFDFDVETLTPVNPGDPTTRIKSRGYNSCDKQNPRTVEREIQVTY